MNDGEAINKLHKIFVKKKWIDHDEVDAIFDSFCTLIQNIDEDQKELIIELTEKYRWITFAEYNSMLISLFNSIEEEKLSKLKTVYLFPIHKPEDTGKTKSGHNVLYLTRGISPTLKRQRYKHIEFEEIETYEGLSNKFNRPMRDDEALILIDDFLGSHETIDATISEIDKIRYIAFERVNVCVIACQKTTKQYIDDKAICLYTIYLSDKGISDCNDEPTLSHKITLMERLETMIPGNHYKFGYNESEALITLIRTPDNTFPIFWKEYRVGKDKFQAPFSRY